MSDLILGNGILLICALFITERSYRLGGEHNTSATVISLSGAFIAASAAASMLLTGTGDQDQQTLLRILNNLAYYAAIPLIGSALFAMAHGYNWQKPAWGRWLLVLLALFELTRRAEAGTEYTQLMAVATSAAMLYAAIRFRDNVARLGCAAGAILLAAAALLLSPVTLLPEYQHALGYPVAIGLMLLCCGLTLPRKMSEPA